MKNAPLSLVCSQLGSFLECSNSQVAGYQIDSRMIGPGDLFFALPGENTDGHNYLKEVFLKGASAAVVKRGTPPQEGRLLLEVEDVEKALQELARWFLKQKPVQIVGVTGSVGKTITKEFAATLLEGRYRVGKSPASYNSRLTFPLNLLNRTGEEELLVLEMGMSEPGDLKRLSSIAAPDLAVLTKVALVHSMNFPKGICDIAQEKASIALHAKTKKMVLNHDLLSFEESMHAIAADKITFSISEPSADYFLSLVDGNIRVDERGVRSCVLDLPFRERFFLENFAAALAVCRQMGLTWEEIERQISKLEIPKMRFEQFEKEGVHFVNDAYNANPPSMMAALDHFPHPGEGGKKIALLASMKELGVFSKSAHEDVGRFAQKRVDVLLCLGEETRPLFEAFCESKKPAWFFLDHDSAARKLAEIKRPGDVVLLKGSRGMHLEKILEKVDAAFFC